MSGRSHELGKCWCHGIHSQVDKKGQLSGVIDVQLAASSVDRMVEILDNFAKTLNIQIEDWQKRVYVELSRNQENLTVRPIIGKIGIQKARPTMLGQEPNTVIIDEGLGLNGLDTKTGNEA